jgi:hypothetical protein
MRASLATLWRRASSRNPIVGPGTALGQRGRTTHRTGVRNEMAIQNPVLVQGGKAVNIGTDQVGAGRGERLPCNGTEGGLDRGRGDRTVGEQRLDEVGTRILGATPVRGQHVVKEIEAAGGSARFVAADLTDPAQVNGDAMHVLVLEIGMSGLPEDCVKWVAEQRIRRYLAEVDALTAARGC